MFASVSLSLLRSVMDLTSDAFTPRDMLAHQHLRPPWLAGNDSLIDPMMIVVAAANVTMLEGNDVAARRHRHVMADPDHLGQHPVGARRRAVYRESHHLCRDRSCDRRFSNEPRSSNLSPARRLRSIVAFSSGLRPRSAANRAANPFERGADLVGIDNGIERKFADGEAAIGRVIQ